MYVERAQEEHRVEWQEREDEIQIGIRKNSWGKEEEEEQGTEGQREGESECLYRVIFSKLPPCLLSESLHQYSIS